MMLQLGRAANGRTEGDLRGRGLIYFGEKDMREEERAERLREYYRERVMGLYLGFKDGGLSVFFFSAELIWLKLFFLMKINLHHNNLVPSQIYGS